MVFLFYHYENVSICTLETNGTKSSPNNCLCSSTSRLVISFSKHELYERSLLRVNCLLSIMRRHKTQPILYLAYCGSPKLNSSFFIKAISCKGITGENKQSTQIVQSEATSRRRCTLGLGGLDIGWATEGGVKSPAIIYTRTACGITSRH